MISKRMTQFTDQQNNQKQESGYINLLYTLTCNQINFIILITSVLVIDQKQESVSTLERTVLYVPFALRMLLLIFVQYLDLELLLSHW